MAFVKKHPSRNNDKPGGKSSRAGRGNREDRAEREPRRERAPDHGPREPRTPKPQKLAIDLYGVHACREAILNADREISAIYATPDMADEVDSWIVTAKKSKINRPGIMMPERAAFDNALPNGAVHQGVGIACENLPELDIDDLLRCLGEGPALLVMLDQVTDPHNMGAIIRTSAAFGAAAVIVQKRNAPDINGLIAKTACGGVDHVPVVYETNLARSIETLKENGFTVFGFDERGDIALHDVQTPERSVVIMGAEGPGMRRLIREGCDVLVRLPTRGAIASLNVSNAAAVALYHFCSK